MIVTRNSGSSVKPHNNNNINNDTTSNLTPPTSPKKSLDIVSETTKASIKVCTNCSATTTPIWRHGPNDELLCNKCGVRYQRNKPSSQPRRQSTRKRNPSRAFSMDGDGAFVGDDDDFEYDEENILEGEPAKKQRRSSRRNSSRLENTTITTTTTFEPHDENNYTSPISTWVYKSALSNIKTQHKMLPPSPPTPKRKSSDPANGNSTNLMTPLKIESQDATTKITNYPSPIDEEQINSLLERQEKAQNFKRLLAAIPLSRLNDFFHLLTESLDSGSLLKEKLASGHEVEIDILELSSAAFESLGKLES